MICDDLVACPLVEKQPNEGSKSWSIMLEMNLHLKRDYCDIKYEYESHYKNEEC